MLALPPTRNMSWLACAGAVSRKSSTDVFFAFASKLMAKPPPPSPQLIGFTTARVNAAATAASTALPPSSSMRSPAREASGWAVATAPFG